MNKLLAGLFLSFVSAGSYAKVSSNDYSSAPSSSCMVRVSDEKTSRFINIAYIRTIELASNENILTVFMASNFYAKRSYLMSYKTHSDAKQALEDLAVKINNCGK